MSRVLAVPDGIRSDSLALQDLVTSTAKKNPHLHKEWVKYRREADRITNLKKDVDLQMAIITKQRRIRKSQSQQPIVPDPAFLSEDLFLNSVPTKTVGNHRNKLGSYVRLHTFAVAVWT